MTDGSCFLCGDAYTKRGMARHLRACLPDDGDSSDHPAVLLRIAGEHRTDYWMHLLVDRETTLSALDAFLRQFWLECCGHLSAFEVGDTRYEDTPGGPGAVGIGIQRRSMDATVGTAFDGVEEATYEYDFGTTTALIIRVVETGGWSLDGLDRTSEGDITTGDAGIRLLTRNDPPERECGSCGSSATHICQTCLRRRGPDAFLCESCASDHEDDCERPAFLPVVNSPRSGVCGYRG